MQVAFVDATFHFKHSVISYSEPILRKRKSPIYAYVFCVNLRTVVSDVWNFYFSTRENALKNWLQWAIKDTAVKWNRAGLFNDILNNCSMQATQQSQMTTNKRQCCWSRHEDASDAGRT